MLSLAANPVIEIPVGLIDPSPLNPRKDFSGLMELAESLRAGQIEAIIVRPLLRSAGASQGTALLRGAGEPQRYEIANGERRWRAAVAGGLPTLGAKVRELTDAEMLDIILGSGATGNVHELNPLEEGDGYAKAMQVMALTTRGVAEHFRRDKMHVTQRVALLGLPDEAKAMVIEGTLLPSTAWLIARIPDPLKRVEHAPAILHSALGVMSYREAKAYIERAVCRALKGAPFAVDDRALVAEAGACTECPFNTANDREAYGDTSANRCMSPGCFERKVAASRARVLAEEKKAGKEPLTAEVNALVFPPEGKGLAWNSGHVEFSRAVPVDLLKAEVASGSRKPTWRELCEDRVTVHVGIDQEGRAVDVVKLEDALTAVPAEELAIFKDEVVRKHNLKMRSTPAVYSTGAPRASAPNSFAETEQAETELREKAARAAKKRDKKSRAWLDDLVTGIEGMAAAGKPAWGGGTGDAGGSGYTYWSLMFELMLRAIGDDDVRFVCEVFGVDDFKEVAKVDGVAARKALTDFAGTLSGGKCGALVTAMTIAPWLRAEGPEAAFVKEWHGAFVEIDESERAKIQTPKAKKAPAISSEEGKQLAELVKAYAAGEGMSPQRCAEEFKMTIEDVCGALQLDLHAVRNVASQLRQDCEAAFAAAGLATITPMNRITKTVTAQRVKEFAEITRPEDFRRLLAMLSRKAPAKVVAASEEE